MLFSTLNAPLPDTVSCDILWNAMHSPLSCFRHDWHTLLIYIDQHASLSPWYTWCKLLQGVLKLKHKAMAEDVRPVDPTCKCMVCVIRGYPVYYGWFLVPYVWYLSIHFSFCRSAKTTQGHIFIALLRKMQWALSFCHITIYITWWRWLLIETFINLTLGTLSPI